MNTHAYRHIKTPLLVNLYAYLHTLLHHVFITIESQRFRKQAYCNVVVIYFMEMRLVIELNHWLSPIALGRDFDF